MNIRDNEGNTPLHVACRESDMDTVKCLLEDGSDRTILNNNGESPINLARKAI